MRRSRAPGDVAALIRGLLKRRVRSALDAVVGDASVGKALRDELAGLRTCRVGRLRIIYRVAGSVIEIVTVGPRATIYAETWRRVRRERLSR